MRVMGILGALLISLGSFQAYANVDQDIQLSDDFFNEDGDYDPNSPYVGEYLRWLDQEMEQEVIGEETVIQLAENFSCKRGACPMWARVSKGEQRLYLYSYGNLINGDGWATSTGTGTKTPDMETTLNFGRIYNKYTSKTNPGGDYDGLGNMPYAVFINYGRGGFAVHGTPRGNWKKLGSKASHGCVRIHPDNAVNFNAMARETKAQYGQGAGYISITK